MSVTSLLDMLLRFIIESFKLDESSTELERKGRRRVLWSIIVLVLLVVTAVAGFRFGITYDQATDPSRSELAIAKVRLEEYEKREKALETRIKLTLDDHKLLAEDYASLQKAYNQMEMEHLNHQHVIDSLTREVDDHVRSKEILRATIANLEKDVAVLQNTIDHYEADELADQKRKRDIINQLGHLDQ